MRNISFTCDNCNKQTAQVTKGDYSDNDIPENWITIEIKNYQNNCKDRNRKLIYCGNMNEQHFCSNKCFTNHFFHDKIEQTK